MHVEVWSSGQAPKYSDPELFTIEIHHGVDYRYRSTTLGYMAIRGDLDVLEFLHEIPASRVHGLYITEKPEPTLLDNEASAAVFNFMRQKWREILLGKKRGQNEGTNS
ncbi:unnamed protein product [Prunus armeniaca]|uniref:Uncharacterized protein n=1 Tax=Prunus armeniaca TaxID=36596 RepID=A0A6J5W1E7_PRUAR|nr:unnamed protein product [Prunus armeniaca]